MQRLLTLLTFMAFLFAPALLVSQTQTFIIKDSYHWGTSFTVVTVGTKVVGAQNMPDSCEFFFENEGRVAYLNIRKNGRFFTHEIPLYSLSYNPCSITYSWNQESFLRSEVLGSGVFQVTISPMGEMYDNVAWGDSCAIIYKLQSGTPPPPPPAMPELFQTLDTLGYGFNFHYSRENEVWYMYSYHKNDDGRIFAAKLSPKPDKSEEYLIEPIGYGSPGSPVYQSWFNFCQTLADPYKGTSITKSFDGPGKATTTKKLIKLLCDNYFK